MFEQISNSRKGKVAGSGKLQTWLRGMPVNTPVQYDAGRIGLDTTINRTTTSIKGSIVQAGKGLIKDGLCDGAFVVKVDRANLVWVVHYGRVNNPEPEAQTESAPAATVKK